MVWEGSLGCFEGALPADQNSDIKATARLVSKMTGMPMVRAIGTPRVVRLTRGLVPWWEPGSGT